MMEFKGAVDAMEWVDAIIRLDGLPHGLNGYQVNIGARDAGTSPHFHFPSMSALGHGARTWYLFRPAQSTYDIRQIGTYLKEPHSPATGTCVQRQGDVLFVPNLWSHGVSYASAVVAYNFLYTGGPLPGV